ERFAGAPGAPGKVRSGRIQLECGPFPAIGGGCPRAGTRVGAKQVRGGEFNRVEERLECGTVTTSAEARRYVGSVETAGGLAVGNPVRSQHDSREELAIVVQGQRFIPSAGLFDQRTRH